MAAPLVPTMRFTLRLAKFPAALGTTIYRWATKPLADLNAWAEGRILGYGTVERKMSTADGDYDIATCDVELSDDDGLFRGLLADATTRYFTSREAALELLSESQRAADPSVWRTVTRGRVTDIQCKPGRRATIRVADEVGSHFSGFDLEKELGVRITRREHPNAKDQAVNRIYPIITGEHSDIGTVDENGAASDKGLLPVIDVGDYLLDGDGNEYTDVPFAFLSAPQNLQVTINGTPGTGEATYGVTAVSPYGETTITSFDVTTVPTVLDVTNNVQLDWDAQDGAVEFRVYKNNKLIARLNNDETFTNPETTYTDNGSDTVGGVVPPLTNTAQIDQVIGGATVSGWGRLIQKMGANPEVLEMYASNLGSPPKRVRVDESLYGSEFLVPGRPGWPYSTPYIEINGIRMGVAYARGPRLEHHRNNTVTITWNGCGDDENGDGSGNTITEAFFALQHVLNEYRLKNDGVGYLTGDYGPLETYSNGVSKLKTSAFEACQDLTVEWIGGRGYQAAIAITEPISLREFLRRFNVSFASNMASNHHGQMYPVLIDDTADSTAGRIYRDRIEVIAMTDQDIDHDAVETRVTYHYSFDADAQKFRVSDQVIDAYPDDAENPYFAPRERAVRQCYYTHDSATAADSNSRHLTRYKVAPRKVGIKTNLLGVEDEVGAQVRLTHYDGAGGTSGDVATPMLVIGNKVDPNPSENVALTLLDLGRILTTGFPLLATDASGAVLGDETSSSPPTTGAYELR